jgi:hypothetical protein
MNVFEQAAGFLLFMWIVMGPLVLAFFRFGSFVEIRLLKRRLKRIEKFLAENEEDEESGDGSVRG